tara:strand:+ start:147 stop:389 length:243 start_codon:yes stop_codon:yes gene_type:complete
MEIGRGTARMVKKQLKKIYLILSLTLFSICCIAQSRYVYNGSINRNGLVLSEKVNYFDEFLEEPNTKTFLQNMKYKFVPV